MSGRRKPQEERFAVWGIVLVFFGVVFLLQSFNILPWTLWGTLWRFWPVLIIVAGLDVLLKRYNTWLVSLLIVALLVASLGVAIWQEEDTSPSGRNTGNYTVSLTRLEFAPQPPPEVA